jgi:hypothetical protein
MTRLPWWWLLRRPDAANGEWVPLWRSGRLAGIGYRFLIACGVWQVGEGSYYATGHWTWANDLARHRPTWPANGVEFWQYVWGGYPSPFYHAHLWEPCGSRTCRLRQCREAAS